MKKWLGGLRERWREKSRERTARRRIIKKNKERLSQEQLFRFLGGIIRREKFKMGKLLGREITEADTRALMKRVDERTDPDLLRLGLRPALDKFKVFSTKADPKKRARVTKLFLRWWERREVLRGFKANDKRRATDAPLQRIESELIKELGGRDRGTVIRLMETMENNFYRALKNLGGLKDEL